MKFNSALINNKYRRVKSGYIQTFVFKAQLSIILQNMPIPISKCNTYKSLILIPFVRSNIESGRIARVYMQNGRTGVVEPQA